MKAEHRNRIVLGLILSSVAVMSAHGTTEKFQPRQDAKVLVMWRINSDPTIRDWAYYHSRQCWSSNGRYIRYVHYPAYFKYTPHPHDLKVYDFLEDRTLTVPIASGQWAQRHPWLLYTQWPTETAMKSREPGELVWWDLSTGEKKPLGVRCASIGTPDWQDQSVCANDVVFPDRDVPQAARIWFRPEVKLDPIPIVGRLDANPNQPAAYSRVSNVLSVFRPTRLFYRMDTGEVSIASPVMQQAHMSWSGGGQYFLIGSGTKGRKWDEPWPSNLHRLAVMGCHDICPCGKNDRWVLGSDSYDWFEFVDLRYGDGVRFLQGLSYIHDSKNYGYMWGSSYHDCDAKGSPDATKVCFVSNYDLKDGPVTILRKTDETPDGRRLHVESTDGFPERGRLTIPPEIVGYERKTSTTFEKLTRGMLGTAKGKWREGTTITSFDARLIPPERRDPKLLSPLFTRKDFADKGSELMWQRRTDVYVAVVRRPDRPWLRIAGDTIELIPGENHWETFGYRVLRDGKPVSDELLRPGGALDLAGGASYTAVAVEHSGLQSEPSNELDPGPATKLIARDEKPDDFSWAVARWSVNGREAPETTARRAARATREIGHRVDGTIHREWYRQGRIVERHDLDPEGRAIRRLFYNEGRLARREYHTREGYHAFTEVFDADGFITESVYHKEWNGERVEWSHWWFVKGAPVKFVARMASARQWPQGAGVYGKKGAKWVKIGPLPNR